MKEKTKKYLRNLGIAYLFAILGLTFKFCRNDKINDFYTLTNETLSSGDVEIYDEDLNVIGKLQYINENNKLFLDIEGEDVFGKKPYTREDYHYNSIKYKNILMTLKQYGDDYYYFYDTGDSVILLCLLKPWFINHTSLEELSMIKNNRQVFMIVEATYDKFQYILEDIRPTIQEPFVTAGGWGQLYRCFFVQEE